MSKGITKEQRKAIHADVDASTLPQELKAIYILANAVELMTQNAFGRLKYVFARNGVIINENELLTGITDYCRYTKMASSLFFQRIEPQISGATFELGRNYQESCEAYDGFAEDSNELCRLFLLYLDRTAKTERWRDVFALLRRMPSQGLFKDEDFTRFKMKRMK